jgi:hypothetical protein
MSTTSTLRVHDTTPRDSTEAGAVPAEVLSK